MATIVWRYSGAYIKILFMADFITIFFDTWALSYLLESYSVSIMKHMGRRAFSRPCHVRRFSGTGCA
jgi:3-methyladenine DNA glycosylase AlkC